MATRKSPEERKGTMHYRIHPVAARAVDGNSRALTFTASTDDVARDGDIIEIDAWKTANYLRNPVFLWMHDPYQLPVGKSINVRTADTLEIDVEFDNDERSDDVMGKYQRGFLNAVSVGYNPLAYRRPDDEERAELGLGPWGVVWTKADLLEVSAVTVPADPGALIKHDAYRSFADRLERDEQLRDAVDETRTDEIDPDPVDCTDIPDPDDDARAVEDALAARLAQSSPASPPASDDLDALKALERKD